MAGGMGNAVAESYRRPEELVTFSSAEGVNTASIMFTSAPKPSVMGGPFSASQSNGNCLRDLSQRRLLSRQCGDRRRYICVRDLEKSWLFRCLG